MNHHFQTRLKPSSGLRSPSQLTVTRQNSPGSLLLPPYKQQRILCIRHHCHDEACARKSPEPKGSQDGGWEEIHEGQQGRKSTAAQTKDKHDKSKYWELINALIKPHLVCYNPDEKNAHAKEEEKIVHKLVSVQSECVVN